jgi:hypothetical protein
MAPTDVFVVLRELEVRFDSPSNQKTARFGEFNYAAQARPCYNFESDFHVRFLPAFAQDRQIWGLEFSTMHCLHFPTPHLTHSSVAFHEECVGQNSFFTTVPAGAFGEGAGFWMVGAGAALASG